MFRQVIARQNNMLDKILAGGGRGSHDPNYGDLYWELEEMCFLQVAEDLETFYAEFGEIILDYLDERGAAYQLDEVREAVHYQRLRIPNPDAGAKCSHNFTYNFPEYFETQLGTAPRSLVSNAQVLTVTQTDYAGNRQEFAREVILWGRKSGLMLTDANWHPASCPPQIYAAE